MEIEEIFSQAQQGKLDLQQAAKLTMEHVFLNKGNYQLDKIPEDVFSEFLLFMLPKFPGIIQMYRGEVASVRIFLYWALRNRLHGFYRKFIRGIAFDDATIMHEIGAMEEKQEQYNIFEKSLEVADNITPEDLKILMKTIAPCPYSHQSPASLTKATDGDLRKEGILLLALKSCCFLNSEIIEKISIVTGLKQNHIMELCQKTREQMKKREENVMNEVQKRNKAYFFRQKYMLEHQKLDKDSGWAQVIEKRYDNQNKKWIQINQALKKKHLAPSNRIISQVTGLDINRVNYILKLVKANVDKINLK